MTAQIIDLAAERARRVAAAPSNIDPLDAMRRELAKVPPLVWWALATFFAAHRIRR